MIISADAIETTETNTGAEVATLEEAQTSSRKKKPAVHRNHVLSISKNLSKLSSSKTKLTWKCFLTEVLKSDSEEIPPNTVLIAKLNDFSSDSEREQYTVLCNEKDFHAIKKVAKEKQCSFSVVVKFLKNEEFNKKHTQKYIDDLMKPNSIHVSITVLGRSYSPKNTVKKVQVLPTDVDNKVNEMRDSLSLIYKNLENLETCIDSINKKNCFVCKTSEVVYNCSTCSNFYLCTKCFEVKNVHDSSHKFFKISELTGNANLESSFYTTKALNSDSEQLSTSPSTSVFELSHTSTLLDSGLDSKSTAVNSNENETVLEETLKESKSDVTFSTGNDNPYSTLSLPCDVEAGSKIAKIWKIRNNGTSQWTSNLTLHCTAGNINPVPEHCTTIPVPLLKPGEEDIIKINFKVPTNLRPGSSIFSVWRFCYKGKTFGTPLNLNATIKPSGYKQEKKPYNDMPAVDLNTANTNDEFIEYPKCFNLNVPFLNSGEFKELPARIVDIFKETSHIKSSPKCDSKSNTKESISIKPLRGISPTTSSSKSLSTGKNKTIAKKLELIENRRQVCHAKKRQLKTAKQSNVQLAVPSTHVPIPVPSSKTMEKIKCKNAANQAKINGSIGQSDAAKKDCHTSEAKKKNKGDKVSISVESKHSSNSFSGSFANPLQGSLEPTLSLVGQTISSIYNMFAIPGTSANSPDENENKQSNTDLKGSNELLQSTLQKLSEMGFCNKKLNVELLIKNNLDIQRTVQELLSSIGNIVSLPATTSGTSAATATSASPVSNCSNNERTTATRSNSSQQKEKGKLSKSCFSVDSVD